MLRGFLVAEADGRRVPVEGSLVVGRTGDCGLMIDDSSASRHHVEITARQDSFVWKDLGSTNGTLLNGEKMLAGELKDGDKIQIGGTVLVFEVEGRAGRAPLLSDSALFRKTMLDKDGVAHPVSAADKSASLLEAAYSVMNEIAQNYDPCSLMDRILETTMRAINAQRGAVFLAAPTSGKGGALSGKLLPCPKCNRVHRIRDGVLQPAAPGELRISQTVAQRVLKNGESVHYQDTDADQELSASESIASLSLRSIICVPLRSKRGILGILYIDSDRQDQAYTHEDMLLAAAVGNSAGLALDNAEMHQQLLEKQRIEHEIATAWTIQEGFLEKEWLAKDARFQVYGETRPAKTVGGDFYDVVYPREGVVGLLIGDVSGKGVPAALTMAQMIAEFRLFARDHASPVEVIQQLNANLFRRSRQGLFCSLCYLRLELSSGAVTCANAGHPPALRLGRDAVGFFGEATGPPAGILAEGPWENTFSRIDLGDTLLLYTDGIVEVRSFETRHDTRKGNVQPVEYGESGLSLVATTLYGQSPKALLDAVNTDIHRFCAPANPHDDCTMIAVRYLADSR